MNYYMLSQDELWQELRSVDSQLLVAARLPHNKDNYAIYESILKTRLVIISVFVEIWSYNPDNLCVSAS